MIETEVGLPNTCSNCGKPPGDTWFAEHEDAARSGQGICDNCANPKKPASGKAKAKTADK